MMNFYEVNNFMLSLLKYLKGYTKQCILGPLFKMLEACFELTVPIIMAKIIDVGIANGDSGYILRMCGLLVLMGVFGLISAVTAQYFAASAAYGFGTAVRRDMFKKINSLSMNRLDSIGAASLITRMTGDINRAESGVNQFLRLFLRSPFIVIGAMIAAFTVDTRCAMIFLVAVPALALIIFIIMKVSVPFYKRSQKSLDKVSKITRENLSGVRVIRAFSRQKKEIEDFSDANAELFGINMKVGGISALLNPLTYRCQSCDCCGYTTGRIQSLERRNASGRSGRSRELSDPNSDCAYRFGTAYRHAYKGGCVRDKDCDGYGTRTRYERGQCRER